MLGAVLIEILGVKAPPSQSRFPLAEIIKKARENQYPKINTTYSIIYFFNFLLKYKTIV